MLGFTQQTYGTTQQWNAATRPLLKGMFGIEIIADGRRRIKLGDGVNLWAELPYAEDESNLLDLLNSEAGRASTAEAALQENIDAEKSRAQAAEGAEVSRASGRENDIEAELTAEAARAMAAEDIISDNLTAEAYRALGAETTLQGTINTEKSRAQSAESALQDNINAEHERAEGAESTLQGSINTEKGRAQTAESVLQGTINTEKSRAQSAESVLQGNITAEESARKNADAALDTLIRGIKETYSQGQLDYLLDHLTYWEPDNVTTERGLLILTENNKSLTGEARRTWRHNIDQLQENLIAEASRAQGAEGAEASRASGRENDIEAELTAEAARAMATEDIISDNLTAEAYRAQGAETTLQVNINAEKGRAEAAESAETERAQNAEYVLQSNINAEAEVRAATDTQIQKNITAEESARKNADAALDTLIRDIKETYPQGQLDYLLDHLTYWEPDNIETEGGLLILTENNKSLAGEARRTWRHNIDQIQDNIDEEAALAKEADIQLQKNINAEAETRISDLSALNELLLETSKHLQEQIDYLLGILTYWAPDNIETEGGLLILTENNKLLTGEARRTWQTNG
jgi:hypothetical protein